MRLFLPLKATYNEGQWNTFLRYSKKHGKIHLKSKKSYLLKLLKMKTFKTTLCRKVKLLRFRKNDLSAL